MSATDTAAEVIAIWLDEQFGFKSKQASKTYAARLIERLRGSQVGFHYHEIDAFVERLLDDWATNYEGLVLEVGNSRDEAVMRHEIPKRRAEWQRLVGREGDIADVGD